MSHRLLMLILVLGMTMMLSAVAFAQADDDDDDDDDDDATDDDDDDADDDATDDDDAAGAGFDASTVEFTEPSALEADKELHFAIKVTHGGAVAKGMNGEEWINQVDLMMPSENYVVDEATLDAPDAINTAPGDGTDISRWEVSFDPTNVTISWQCFSVVTSANYGDIRPGDSLIFEFNATTDSEATDGFMWTLYGDEGNTLSEIAYVGSGSDDDDDATDDDDDEVPSDDDDDDDSGCCG